MELAAHLTNQKNASMRLIRLIPANNPTVPPENEKNDSTLKYMFHFKLFVMCLPSAPILVTKSADMSRWYTVNIGVPISIVT